MSPHVIEADGVMWKAASEEAVAAWEGRMAGCVFKTPRKCVLTFSSPKS